MVKAIEFKKTFASAIEDLLHVVEQVKGHYGVTAMHSYKLLVSVFKKQRKYIPVNSLQNPSYSDATYSGHKSQGYQVQVLETYMDTEDKKLKTKSLNLITHVQVEKACQSNAKTLILAIKSTKKRNLSAQEFEADALYGSDDNYQSARSIRVEVVSMNSTVSNELYYLTLQNVYNSEIRQDLLHFLNTDQKAA